MVGSATQVSLGSLIDRDTSCYTPLVNSADLFARFALSDQRAVSGSFLSSGRQWPSRPCGRFGSDCASAPDCAPAIPTCADERLRVFAHPPSPSRRSPQRRERRTDYRTVAIVGSGADQRAFRHQRNAPNCRRLGPDAVRKRVKAPVRPAGHNRSAARCRKQTEEPQPFGRRAKRNPS
jgi:hypothetical protein